MPAGSLSSIGSAAFNGDQVLGTHPTQKRKSGKSKVGAGTTQPSDGGAAQLYSAWPVTGPGSGTTWVYTGNSQIFGQPVADGYDAAAANPGTARKSTAENKISGYLASGNGGYQLGLFATSIDMDTELSGSTAQSKFVQDFYPNNFVQPAITVSGWCLDQEDYGTLCEFVHYCQTQSLQASAGWPSSMTQLVILGRSSLASGSAYTGTIRGLPDGTDGANTKYGPFTSARAVTATYQKGASAYNQSVKGDHDTIIAKGYVATMPRIHQQFEYAVQWQFSFIIAAMLHGLYKDNDKSTVRLPGVAGSGSGTWVDMLSDAKAVGLSTVSAAQNTASLAYAASHSATYLGESPAGGSANASGSGSGSTGSGSYTVTGNISAWTDAENQIGRQILQQALTSGCTKGGGCGLVGNAFQESSMDTTLASGLFGFLGPEQTAFDTWKGSHGIGAASQVQYILTRVPSGTLNTLKSSNDPSTCALDVYNNYEKADDGTGPAREANAQLAFAAYSVTQSQSGGSGGASANGTPTSSMVKLYNYAVANNAGNSGGHCLEYMQQHYLPGTGAPGHQIPLLPYAWDFAVWCQGGTCSNGIVGGGAAQAGLKILSSTNPYDAPQGCIVVVPYPSPGTSAHTGVPNYDGDISVASGSGQFINDGPNEQYGGSSAAWVSAGHNAVLLVPTGFGN